MIFYNVLETSLSEWLNDQTKKVIISIAVPHKKTKLCNLWVHEICILMESILSYFIYQSIKTYFTLQRMIIKTEFESIISEKVIYFCG